MGSLPEDKSWWMKLKGRSPSHQLTWVVNDLSQWGGVLLLGGCSWRGWWVTQPNPFLLYFCLKSRSPRIRKRSLSHPIPTQTTPNFSQYSHQDPVMFLLLLFPLTHLDQCLSCIWNLRSCKPFSLSIFKYIFFLPFMKLHFSIFDSIYFIPLVCLLVRKLISDIYYWFNYSFVLYLRQLFYFDPYTIIDFLNMRIKIKVWHLYKN